MPNYDYHAKVRKFVKQMASRDFGVFLISGESENNRNLVITEYVNSFPHNVRVMLVTDKNDNGDSMWGDFGNNVTVMDKSANTDKDTLDVTLAIRPSVIVWDGNIDPDAHRRLLMASVACNVAISNHAHGFDIGVNHYLAKASQDTGLPHAIIVDRVKGFAYAGSGTVIMPSGKMSYPIVTCLSNSGSAKEEILAVSFKSPGVGLAKLSIAQGWPSAKDQKFRPEGQMRGSEDVAEYLQPILADLRRSRTSSVQLRAGKMVKFTKRNGQSAEQKVTKPIIDAVSSYLFFNNGARFQDQTVSNVINFNPHGKFFVTYCPTEEGPEIGISTVASH